MVNRIRTQSQSARRENRDADNSDTRQRLLEAAGQVFAEKGFDRATGKEITELAGTNTAAVNYYFGGIEGLYTAVFDEASSRLVTTEALHAAVAGRSDAKAKLEAFLGLLVQALTRPTATSWMGACRNSRIHLSDPGCRHAARRGAAPAFANLEGHRPRVIGFARGRPGRRARMHQRNSTLPNALGVRPSDAPARVPRVRFEARSGSRHRPPHASVLTRRIGCCCR